MLALAFVATLSPRRPMSQSEFVGSIQFDIVNKGKYIALSLATDGHHLREDIVPNDPLSRA
jgi:hypothetical protein